MHNHFERAGNRRGWVTEREADAFFAVVNCQDSHKAFLPPSSRRTLRFFLLSSFILYHSSFIPSPLKCGMARSVPTATMKEKVRYGVNSPAEDFSPNGTALHLMHIPELIVSLEQGPRTE